MSVCQASYGIDLLSPSAKLEKKKHKLKRPVQSPNSFMDVKCQGCFNMFNVSLLVFCLLSTLLLSFKIPSVSPQEQVNKFGNQGQGKFVLVRSRFFYLTGNLQGFSISLIYGLRDIFAAPTH